MGQHLRAAPKSEYSWNHPMELVILGGGSTAQRQASSPVGTRNYGLSSDLKQKLH